MTTLRWLDRRRVKVLLRSIDVIMAILLAYGTYSVYESWQDRKGLVEACDVLGGTYIEYNGKARCLKAENLFTSEAHK